MKKLLFALAAILFVSACPKTDAIGTREIAQKDANRQRHLKMLGEVADGYYKYMQWEKFKQAAEFVVAGDPRGEFLADMRKEPLKLTEYEILNVSLDEDFNGATVLVSMSRVRPEDLILEEAEYKHRWLRDRAGKWYVYYPYREDKEE